MPSHSQAAFLVNAQSDPVILRIVGKASYLNCAPVSRFFEEMIADGRRQFVIDFGECTGMDSTFLGILAATAMDLKEQEPPGDLVLCRMNARIQELVFNVGLHRMLTMDRSGFEPKYAVQQPLTQDDESESEKLAANSRLVLKAHEALCEIDEENVQKFQDVVAFLKRQVEDE